MPAIVFPSAPVLNDVYPLDPGTSGVTQYKWDGTKWVSVPTTVSLGSPNQGAFNDYQWPATDGAAGRQLTTDGAGNLIWDVTATSSLQALSVTPAFDGTLTTFTLVDIGTSTPFTPSPSNNIIVFLGGVPQIPGPLNAYTVLGNQITFTSPPPLGTTFYAISNIVL